MKNQRQQKHFEYRVKQRFIQPVANAFEIDKKRAPSYLPRKNRPTTKSHQTKLQTTFSPDNKMVASVILKFLYTYRQCDIIIVFVNN